MDNEQTKDTSGLEKEIINLKSQLDSINKKKEEAFKNKEDLKKQLSELIKKVRGVTSQNKKEGVNVQQLKKQRDQHNSNVKRLIAEIKTLGGGKRSDVNAYDFMRLKKDLEALEFKVEHEALSPSDEKKTMKKIKELKKHYDAQNEFMKSADRSHELSKKIEEEKKLADQFHNQLMAAKGDTMDYNKLKTVSHEILDMRSKQEAEFANFIRLKQEFKEISEQLKQKLAIAGRRPLSLRSFPKDSEADHKHGEHRHSERPRYNRNKKKNNFHENSASKASDEKKKEQMKIIQEKAKEVEEKLKSGQKLTTEDLLILQQKAD